ncbi:exosome component 10-like [Sorex fumeus]|uniref:exosome component 10-like n=1 Tax=Sorex fumeus TaxID=62283 RepID=UPI0024ACEE44|nr:exosome component 10-like [Sorex fumeus]
MAPPSSPGPKGSSAASVPQPEEGMVLPGFPDIDSFMKFALRSVVAVIKASGSLPQSGPEYDFYQSFPGFQAFCETQGDRMLECMSRMMQYYVCQSDIKDCSKVTDLEDKFDLLVDANDAILDGVDILLDEASGMKKHQQPVLPIGSQARQMIVSSWNRKAEESGKKTKSEPFRLLHVKNIIRPQLKFREKIDNSNTPFVPKIFIKPNALKPLPRALSKESREHTKNQSEDPDVPPALVHFLHQQRTQQVEQDVFAHPYQYELDHFTPPEWALQKPQPQAYKPLQDTACHLVTSLDQLVQLNTTLLACWEFAVDLEHHFYRSFLGLTCLMQISTRTEDFIIDTLELRSDMHLLNESFTDSAIVKVFHGANSDIEWLQKDFGLYVVNMFDTQQAARLLRLGRHSLDHLLKRYCNVQANKQYQLADWRVRPLPEEMLHYAREDTHYLLYIYDCMRLELWAAASEQPTKARVVWQRSRDICLRKFAKPLFTDESYLKLYEKLKTPLNAQQLTAFRLLFAWRDHLARREDESCCYVLPNRMMLKISEELPEEPQGIIACCTPVPPLVWQQLHELHLLIQKARGTPLCQSEVSTGVRRRALLPHPERLENVLVGPHDRSHAWSGDCPAVPTNRPVPGQTQAGLLPAQHEEKTLLATSRFVATAADTLFNEASAEQKDKTQKKVQPVVQSLENPFGMLLQALQHHAHISQAAKADPSSNINEISERWEMASQAQGQKDSKDTARKRAAQATAAQDEAKEGSQTTAQPALSLRQQIALENAAKKRERTSDPRAPEQRQEKKWSKLAEKPKEPREAREKASTSFDYCKPNVQAFAGNSKSQAASQFDPGKQIVAGKKFIAAKELKQTAGNKSMSFLPRELNRGFRCNWPRRPHPPNFRGLPRTGRQRPWDGFVYHPNFNTVRNNCYWEKE